MSHINSASTVSVNSTSCLLSVQDRRNCVYV